MCFVYLINIERTDLYKIGITSKTPQKRLKKLQTGCALRLVLVDTYESDDYKQIETTFHRMFKHKKNVPEDFENLHGEWFKLTFDDVIDFKNICSKIEENLNYLRKNSTYLKL